MPLGSRKVRQSLAEAPQSIEMLLVPAIESEQTLFEDMSCRLAASGQEAAVMAAVPFLRAAWTCGLVAGGGVHRASLARMAGGKLSRMAGRTQSSRAILPMSC